MPSKTAHLNSTSKSVSDEFDGEVSTGDASTVNDFTPAHFDVSAS